MVGTGLALMRTRTLSPLSSSCRCLPSKHTHADALRIGIDEIEARKQCVMWLCGFLSSILRQQLLPLPLLAVEAHTRRRPED